jgi:protein phosphatase
VRNTHTARASSASRVEVRSDVCREGAGGRNVEGQAPASTSLDLGEAQPARLTIPDRALVVLIGPSGAGKSTFAAKHFRATEIVSSDECRAMVSDDENDMSATPAAFRLLHAIAGERLRARRLTVIDATSVQRKWRIPLLALAVEHRRPTVAIVFDVPEELCIQRNRERAARNLGAEVIHRQVGQMERSLEGLGEEGFGQVYILDSPGALDSASVVRQRVGKKRTS